MDQCAEQRNQDHCEPTHTPSAVPERLHQLVHILSEHELNVLYYFRMNVTVNAFIFLCIEITYVFISTELKP